MSNNSEVILSESRQRGFVPVQQMIGRMKRTAKPGAVVYSMPINTSDRKPEGHFLDEIKADLMMDRAEGMKSDIEAMEASGDADFDRDIFDSLKSRVAGCADTLIEDAKALQEGRP